MNATITLFIYWSISVGLIAGGVFALYKGFKLIEMGQGGNAEKNYIKIFNFEAALGSIGSLIMFTAFLWGYAAVLALPDYEDPEVLISSSQKQPIESIELDYYRSSLLTPEEYDVNVKAMVLANEGEHQQAIEIIDRELNQVSDADSRASLIIDAGSILYNALMYEDAINRFEEVVEIEESDPFVREQAYWYLGNTYLQLNKLEKAKQAFRNAHEFNGPYSRITETYLKSLTQIE